MEKEKVDISSVEKATATTTNSHKCEKSRLYAALEAERVKFRAVGFDPAAAPLFRVRVLELPAVALASTPETVDLDAEQSSRQGSRQEFNQGLTQIRQGVTGYHHGENEVNPQPLIHRYHLFLSIHHLIVDGWSITVLLKALANAYADICTSEVASVDTHSAHTHAQCGLESETDSSTHQHRACSSDTTTSYSRFSKYETTLVDALTTGTHRSTNTSDRSITRNTGQTMRYLPALANENTGLRARIALSTSPSAGWAYWYGYVQRWPEPHALRLFQARGSCHRATASEVSNTSCSVRLAVDAESGEEVSRLRVPLSAEASSWIAHCSSALRVSRASLLHAVWCIAYGAMGDDDNDDDDDDDDDDDNGEQTTDSSDCVFPEIVYGYTTSGRTAAMEEIASVIGPVVNTLPLRVSASMLLERTERPNSDGRTSGTIENITAAASKAKPKPSFTDLVQFLYKRITENLEYENTPLSTIQQIAGVRGRQMFSVIFDYQITNGWNTVLSASKNSAELSCKNKALSMHSCLLQDRIGCPLTIRVFQSSSSASPSPSSSLSSSSSSVSSVSSLPPPISYSSISTGAAEAGYRTPAHRHTDSFEVLATSECRSIDSVQLARIIELFQYALFFIAKTLSKGSIAISSESVSASKAPALIENQELALDRLVDECRRHYTSLAHTSHTAWDDAISAAHAVACGSGSTSSVNVRPSPIPSPVPSAALGKRIVLPILPSINSLSVLSPRQALSGGKAVLHNSLASGKVVVDTHAWPSDDGMCKDVTVCFFAVTVAAFISTLCSFRDGSRPSFDVLVTAWSEGQDVDNIDTTTTTGTMNTETFVISSDIWSRSSTLCGLAKLLSPKLHDHQLLTASHYSIVCSTATPCTHAIARTSANKNKMNLLLKSGSSKDTQMESKGPQMGRTTEKSRPQLNVVVLYSSSALLGSGECDGHLNKGQCGGLRGGLSASATHVVNRKAASAAREVDSFIKSLELQIHSTLSSESSSNVAAPPQQQHAFRNHPLSPNFTSVLSTLVDSDTFVFHSELSQVNAVPSPTSTFPEDETVETRIQQYLQSHVLQDEPWVLVTVGPLKSGIDSLKSGEEALSISVAAMAETAIGTSPLCVIAVVLEPVNSSAIPSAILADEGEIVASADFDKNTSRNETGISLLDSDVEIFAHSKRTAALARRQWCAWSTGRVSTYSTHPDLVRNHQTGNRYLIWQLESLVDKIASSLTHRVLCEGPILRAGLVRSVTKFEKLSNEVTYGLKIVSQVRKSVLFLIRLMLAVINVRPVDNKISKIDFSSDVVY